jgi:hypothetical protein
MVAVMEDDGAVALTAPPLSACAGGVSIATSAITMAAAKARWDERRMRALAPSFVPGGGAEADGV